MAILLLAKGHGKDDQESRRRSNSPCLSFGPPDTFGEAIPHGTNNTGSNGRRRLWDPDDPLPVHVLLFCTAQYSTVPYRSLRYTDP